MPADFRCLLCSNAGQPTLAPRANRSTSRICADHHAALLATGRRWCPRRLHVVAAQDFDGAYCHACDRERQRRTPAAPAGYVRYTDVARRLYVSEYTVRRWLRAGWPVAWLRVGYGLYVADMDAYPPAPVDPRKGVRRRPELDACKVCQRPIVNTSTKPRCCPSCRSARLSTGARRAS